MSVTGSGRGTMRKEYWKVACPCDDCLSNTLFADVSGSGWGGRWLNSAGGGGGQQGGRRRRRGWREAGEAEGDLEKSIQTSSDMCYLENAREDEREEGEEESERKREGIYYWIEDDDDDDDSNGNDDVLIQWFNASDYDSHDTNMTTTINAGMLHLIE
uniref:Transposase-associated domain-containing protein n=1 Tax=Setaria digitata TaxID=48799 RepID=A0A915Q7M9_9BILA